MEATPCGTCRKTKAPLQCGVCESHLCKSCAQIVDDDAFAFLEKTPPELKHKVYCGSCFDQKVAPALASYNEVLERAKNVNVFFKTQGKETRSLKRKEAPVQIKDCPDKDEALLRLAFLAAELGFNTLIDVNLTAKKLIVNHYQTSVWSGTGIPTQVDEKRINLGLRNPN